MKKKTTSPTFNQKKFSGKNKHQSASNKSTSGQVRIIGGQFKRRHVTFIDADGLRPTPDRLRETLFNWLLSDIHDARVLDSCAGSGVLGFEALSRGAAHCTFIEANNTQAHQLVQSAAQLNLETNSYDIIYGAAEHVLAQNTTQNITKHKPFHIVFIDPPYAEQLWQPILTTLITQHLITADTLIYLEADIDLTDQLYDLLSTLEAPVLEQGLTTFNCLKQTKVGQVVAGLYQLSAS